MPQVDTSFPSSDLGLLKRDQKLQQRYDVWIMGIKEKYGSVGEANSIVYMLHK